MLSIAEQLRRAVNKERPHKTEKRRAIKEWLEGKTVSVRMTAKHFNITGFTARRYLQDLVKQGDAECWKVSKAVWYRLKRESKIIDKG